MTAIGMSATTLVAALLGLGTGVGLLLVIRGWRGMDPPRILRFPCRVSRPRADQRLMRLITAVAVGVVAGVLTGWVAGAARGQVAPRRGIHQD